MAAYLLDTNVLVRSCDAASPLYMRATDVVSRLLADNEQVYITAQNIIEFWAVATRPLTANGLGFDIRQTASEVERLLNQFQLLGDNPDIFTHWWQLVNLQGVSGKRAHDARLVAVMLAHRVTHLLTFNTEDFKSFTGIILVHPDDVV